MQIEHTIICKYRQNINLYTLEKPMSTEPKRTSLSQSSLNLWALGMSAGIKIALPLIIMVFIGIKLDKQFGTLPLFIIIAFILSFIASLHLLLRDVNRLNQQSSEKKLL